MRDDDGHAADASYLEGLVHGVEDGIGFAADVRGVDGACGRQWLREREHFFRRGGVGGEIGEAGAQAQGAVVEGLLQLCAHGVDFKWSCGAVEAVHVVVAERGVAYERSDVYGGSRLADNC